MQHLDAEEALAEALDGQQRSAAQARTKRWRCASMTAAAQDHPALDREHRGERQAEQRQALVDDGEEQGAEHHPDHLALAAEQADAADHRGTHDVEQDALAQHRRAGLEPGGVEDGGDAGAGAADRRRPRTPPGATGTPETSAARGLTPIANSQRPKSDAAERDVRGRRRRRARSAPRTACRAMRPWPRKAKPGGRLPIELPSGVSSVVIQIARPEKNIIVVSVTMKGGMLNSRDAGAVERAQGTADGDEDDDARGDREPGRRPGQRPAVEGHDRGRRARWRWRGSRSPRDRCRRRSGRRPGRRRRSAAASSRPGCRAKCRRATISGTSGTMAAT